MIEVQKLKKRLKKSYAKEIAMMDAVYLIDDFFVKLEDELHDIIEASNGEVLVQKNLSNGKWSLKVDNKLLYLQVNAENENIYDASSIDVVVEFYDEIRNHTSVREIDTLIFHRNNNCVISNNTKEIISYDLLDKYIYDF